LYVLLAACRRGSSGVDRIFEPVGYDPAIVQRTPLGPPGPQPTQPPVPRPQLTGGADHTRLYQRIIAALGVVIVGLLIAVAAVGGAGPFAKSAPAVSTRWSAVLLSDGEIFFGHVKSATLDHIELVNVYYVQKPPSTTTTGTTPSAQSPISIVGLVSNQLQCPLDDITINRSLVLYWEDLQNNSYVAQKLNQQSQTPQSCFQPPTPTPPLPRVSPTP
jgi:hypothetical protein